MQADLFRKSAVLIEQNGLQQKLYSDILSANGFDVYVAKSAMDGLMRLREHKQDLTVINTEIAEESFVEKLISNIRSANNKGDAKIVGLSIYASEVKKNIAKKLDAFLTKPISIDTFVGSIVDCIEKKSDVSENIDNRHSKEFC